MLEKIEEKTIYIVPKNLFEGDFVANGKSSQKLADNASKITVNGNAILSEFITQDKTSSFVYIPQDKITDGALYTVKLNPVNHNDFIEKRRRTMYLSYSVLVTSLIPTIITKGVVQSYRTMLGDSTKKLAIQDLDNKRHTEIEMFGGTMIEMGKKYNIAVPYATFCYHAIKALEEKNDGKFDYE